MEEIQNNETDASRTHARAMRGETATGDLRIHPFHSRIYRNDRFLRVLVPPGYDDADNAAYQYPVLYLNDGQNLFEPATSFNGVEWQVDETADRLIRQQVIPPMIIVGIDNAGKDRVREYMPHRSFQPMMLRVQGTRYPSFLTKEVIPFVERHYRVASGPRNTGLGGSSLGALIALYGHGFTWDRRPLAVGESLVVGRQSPDHAAESHSPALAGKNLPSHRQRRGRTTRSGPQHGR